jgi:hypothetical protein
MFHAFLNDRACAWSAPKRRRGHRNRPSRASLSAAARACCTATARTCCATTTARSRNAFGLGGPGLSRRRARACVPEGQRPGRVRRRHRRRGTRRLPPARAHRGILAALESSHAIAQA